MHIYHAFETSKAAWWHDRKIVFLPEAFFSFSSQTTFHMQEFDANILKFFKALGFDVLILNYS
jgi:hypothetical protein